MTRRFVLLRDRFQQALENSVRESQPTAALVTGIKGTGTNRIVWVNPISDLASGLASGGGRMPIRHTGPFEVNVGDTVLITRGRSPNPYIIGFVKNATDNTYYPRIRADRIEAPGGTLTLPSSIVGAVTSVALSMPAEFAVAGSPITSAGTLAVSKANQNANLSYAGPPSGGPAAPAFRALVSDDIPTLDHNTKLSNLAAGDVHIQYALLAPASSARNVIQPTGAAVIPFIVRGAASQSANLQEWQDSTPTILSYIDSVGGAKFPSLGIASANPNPTLYGVNINKTVTDAAAVRHSGIEGLFQGAPAANTAGGYVGAIFDARLTTNVNLTKTVGGLIGFEGLIRHQGSGIMTSGVSVLVDGPVVSGGGTITTWNGIAFSAASITSGSVTNAVAIEVRDITFGATLNIALRTNAGLVIFNEGGDANADLRIEGDTDANLLFTDASTDRVGIGTNAPTTKGHVLLTDAGTAAVVNVATIGHDSSGTPAAGFGAGLIFEGESDTTASQSMGRLTYEWATATHASRKARGKITVFDTVEREVIRIEASGSAPMLGLFGVNAVVRPTALTAQLTAITHTAPGTPDYAIQDLTQTTPWGFASHDEGNTVLSVVANLQTRVGELETKLQAIGAIT